MFPKVGWCHQCFLSQDSFTVSLALDNFHSFFNFSKRTLMQNFHFLYCVIGIVNSLPCHQMCLLCYVMRLLLPSTGQQVHFQCVWIGQPLRCGFAPVTRVTSLTGYAANEFLMSWIEHGEWSDAFHSPRGSQKLTNPEWWLRNISDGRRTWIHDALWKLLHLTSSGSDSVLASCVFMTVGHERLKYTGTHTLLSSFCHPADNWDQSQNIFINPGGNFVPYSAPSNLKMREK